MDMFWLFFLQAVLIFLNAVFAGTEIAVLSVSEAKAKQLAESGSQRGVRLLRLVQNRAGFLATIQIAVTLSGFLGAAFASDSFAQKLSSRMQQMGIGLCDSVMDTIAVILVTLVISFVSIVFGEMIPKRIAMQRAQRLSLAMSGPVTVLAWLFSPLVWVLTKTTNGLLRLCGIDPYEDKERVSKDDILLTAETALRDGTLTEEQLHRIQDALRQHCIKHG